jgi:hypothetical protein
VLTNRYTQEYSEAYFGIDYDQKIVHWIEQNYSMAGQFGDFRRYYNAPRHWYTSGEST